MEWEESLKGFGIGDINDDGYLDIVHTIGVNTIVDIGPFDDSKTYTENWVVIESTDFSPGHVRIMDGKLLIADSGALDYSGQVNIVLPESGTLDAAEATFGGENAWDRVGSGLVWGDLDQDGSNEIFVGASPTIDPGKVYLMNQDLEDVSLLTQNISGDQFSRLLIVGDYDQDGVEDLAVGATGNTQYMHGVGGVYIYSGNELLQNSKLE